MRTDQIDLDIQKKSDRLSIGEMALIGAATAFGFGAGYLILSDYSFMQQSYAAKGDPIAVITESTNVVKRRPAEVPVWNTVGVNEKLYLKDQIFTDSQSNAKFIFDNNDVVEVGENALIVIERTDTSATITLKQGTIRTKSTKKEGKRALKVKVAGSEANLDSASAIIKADGKGKASVQVLAGKAKLTTKGKAIDIQKDQQSDIEKNKAPEVKTLPILIKSNQYEMQHDNLGRPFRLAWKKNPRINEYNVQLASTAEFKSIGRQLRTSGTAADINKLAAGKYYVRVSGFDPLKKEMVYSTERLINVADRKPPTLIWPPQNKTFTYVKGELNLNKKEGVIVYLDWQGKTERYRVQLSRDPKFKKLIYKRSNSKPPQEAPTLRAGKYYWRVANLPKDGERVVWSEVGKFNINPGKKEKSKGSSIYLVDDRFPKIPISWERIPRATGYQLQLSSSKKFSKSKVFLNNRIDSTLTDWQSDRLGKVYWRVAPIISGKKTRFTVSGNFQLIGKKPKLLAPENEESLVSLKNEGIRFSWQSPKFLTRFQLQVAKDAKFKRIIHKQATELTELNVNKLEKGFYYWRIYATNLQGSKLYSETYRSFRLQLLAPQKIALLSPENEHQHIVAGQNPPLTFKWDSTGGKARYRFELASDQEFSKIVASKLTTKKEFRTPIRKGNYFWRVGIVIKDQPINWSRQIRSLKVRSVLDAPTLAKRKTIEFDQGSTPLVAFNWSKVSGASGYRIQFAKDSDFSTPIKEFRSDKPKIEEPFMEGKYYSRVAGYDTDGDRGKWSKPMLLAIKRIPILDQPILKYPSENATFAYRENQPKVPVSWSSNPDAKDYEVQVATDDGFSNLVVKRKLKQASLAANFPAGSYYVRVRNYTKLDRPSKWSAARSFNINQITDVPQAITPDNDEVVDFDQDEVRFLQLTWSIPDDVGKVNLVVSRDPNFRNVMINTPVDATVAKVKIKEDGPYYWYVEGKDRKEKLALRSDTKTFMVKTTDVKQFVPVERRSRVELGYIPGSFSSQHSINNKQSVSGEDTKFNSYENGVIQGTFMQAYMAGLRGWLNKYIGYDFEGSLRTADVEVPNSLNPTDTYRSYEGTLMLRYRFLLLQDSFPFGLTIRAGYNFHEINTLYPANPSEDGSKSVALLTSGTHNAAIGSGIVLPLGGSYSLQSKIDFIKILTADNIIFQSGHKISSRFALIHEFLRSGILGWGIYYDTSSIAFNDETHNMDGTLSSALLGLLLSAGYSF